LLKDCRQRGLNEPAGWIADGALGLWAAVNEQSRSSAQQRCTNHKTMNVIDKLPKSEQPEATTRVRGLSGRLTAKRPPGSWRRRPSPTFNRRATTGPRTAWRMIWIAA
jgi:transposase-like protein